jgi:hypothetical protein
LNLIKTWTISRRGSKHNNVMISCTLRIKFKFILATTFFIDLARVKSWAIFNNNCLYFDIACEVGKKHLIHLVLIFQKVLLSLVFSNPTNLVNSICIFNDWLKNFFDWLFRLHQNGLNACNSQVQFMNSQVMNLMILWGHTISIWILIQKFHIMKL